MQKIKVTSLMLSLLAIFEPVLADVQQPESPFIANPVALHRYINRTIPNVAIIVDNSNNMVDPMSMVSAPNDNKYRAIDVVKLSLLKLYPEVNAGVNYDIALIATNDIAKDMHWKVDDTAERGFIFAPGVGIDNIFDGINDIYEYAPTTSEGVLQRSLGSGMGRSELGFNKYAGSTLVGNIQTDQEYVTGSSEEQKRKMGLAMLSPLLNKATNNAGLNNYQSSLKLLTKTITLSDGNLEDVYENTLKYLQNNVEYRCQNSAVIVITNNIVNMANNKNIVDAAEKFATEHPKSSHIKDKEGKLYNQRDFPDQYIKSYLLGLKTKPMPGVEFNLTNPPEAIMSTNMVKFGSKAKTEGILAEYSGDLHRNLEIVFNDLKPNTQFTASAPAVYLWKDSFTKEPRQLWAYANSDTHGWFGHLQFKTEYGADDFEIARYTNLYRTFMNTDKGLVHIGDAKLSESGMTFDHIQPKTILTNADFGLSDDEKVENFLKWINGTLPVRDNKHYRVRANDVNSEKRYLGDITNDNIEIMGKTMGMSDLPVALVVGSNDGMLKIYNANPLYFENVDDELFKDISEKRPYVYQIAYIPGNAKRSNGTTLMQNLKYRADPSYGEELSPLAHEYGVGGQIAYRTTNKNQNFIVSSFGQGAFGAVALNISGNAHENSNQQVGAAVGDIPQRVNTSFLWDTNSSAFGKAQEGSEAIGHIMGRPVIARIAQSRDEKGIPDLYKDVHYVAVLPSGEFGDQSKDSGPTLYIYDAIGVDVALGQDKKTDQNVGKLIQKVTYKGKDAGSLKYKNSLSAPTLVDLTFDGVADVGYVGDLNGNLYRLDLRGKQPSDWTLEMIYKGDPEHPIIHAPSVSRYDGKNVVIFGTGSYLRKGDFKSAFVQQEIVGIFDNETFTEYKDKPLTSNDNFVDQDLTGRLEDDARKITNKEVEKENVGWRIRLADGDVREGLSQKPVIYNGTVFFQTYLLHKKEAMSDTAMCYHPAENPDTWLFQINARTGGTLGDKDTRLKEMKNEHAIQFDGIILPTLKLVQTEESSSTSKDGEMQNGNDPDFELQPDKSEPKSYALNKKHYLNKEGKCYAIVTNGMNLECPPYDPQLIKKRVSIMKQY